MQIIQIDVNKGNNVLGFPKNKTKKNKNESFLHPVNLSSQIVNGATL